MRFFYEIEECDYIDVNDFQEIYDFVENELKKQYLPHKPVNVYNEFIDNFDWYIVEIYHAQDYNGEINSHFIQKVISAFDKWCDEKFGKNWYNQ